MAGAPDIHEPIDFDGHRILLDEHDSLGLRRYGVFEPAEYALLPRLVRPGDLCVDVGANIGYYTLPLARLAGPSGRVLAYEPEPACFRLLEQNVRLNGYEAHVTPAPRAVAECRGRVALHVNNGTNRGDHRIYDPGEPNRTVVNVECVALDDELGDGAAVALVKMDIQGAELRALHGMRRTLRRSRDARLLTEFWPMGLARAGSDAAAFLAELRALGFRLHVVDDRHPEPAPVEPEELLSQYPVDRDAFTNLLCTR